MANRSSLQYILRYGKPSLIAPGTQSFSFISFITSMHVFLSDKCLRCPFNVLANADSFVNSFATLICNELRQISFLFFFFFLQISQLEELHPTVNSLLNCYLRNIENRQMWLAFSRTEIFSAFFLPIYFTNVTSVLSWRLCLL